MRLYKYPLVLALLLGSSALAACGPEKNTAAANGEKVLRVVPPTDLEILDTNWTTSYLTRDHGFMVYDTLFGIDAAGKIQPQMVDSYDVSADRKTWTFTLREGLEFHDGQPVTSEDVIASIRRWTERDTMGQRLITFVEQFEAVSPITFRVKLKTPYEFLLESFSKPYVYALFILPRRIADSPKPIDDPIGSGPFVFKKDEWRPGEKIVYVRNSKYKPRPEPASGTAGGKVVKVDRVEWVVIKDPQVRVSALLAGEVDMIAEVAVESYAALRGDPNVQLLTIYPSGYQYFLRFNHLVPPFDNPKVRLAAMAAMNQQAFLQTQVAYTELYSTCFSIYACNGPYASNAGMSFLESPNPERARELLKESGYRGEPIVVLQPTDLAILNKLPTVATDLLRKAGFNVDIQSMDMNTLIARRAKKEGWSLFPSYGAWSSRSAPISQNSLSGAGYPKAWTGWPNDAALEKLRDAFALAGSEEERKAIATRIQVRAMEVGTHVPLGEFRIMTAARKNLKGFLTGYNFMLFWNLEKQ